jgi:hypothetical protein
MNIIFKELTARCGQFQVTGTVDSFSIVGRKETILNITPSHVYYEFCKRYVRYTEIRGSRIFYSPKCLESFILFDTYRVGPRKFVSRNGYSMTYPEMRDELTLVLGMSLNEAEKIMEDLKIESDKLERFIP